MKRKSVLAVLVAAVLVVLLGGFASPAFAGENMKKYMNSPGKDSDIVNFLNKPDRGMLQIMKGTCGTAHGGTSLYKVCMAALNEAFKIKRKGGFEPCPGSQKWVARGKSGVDECKCPEKDNVAEGRATLNKKKNQPVCIAKGISDECFVMHDGTLSDNCNCPEFSKLNKEELWCERPCWWAQTWMKADKWDSETCDCVSGTKESALPDGTPACECTVVPGVFITSYDEMETKCRVCGNSEIEGVEECDDGNKEDGDCCSSECELEEYPEREECPECPECIHFSIFFLGVLAGIFLGFFIGWLCFRNKNKFQLPPTDPPSEQDGSEGRPKTRPYLPGEKPDDPADKDT